MVSSTLKLGISILNGGNSDVQQVIILHYYEAENDSYSAAEPPALTSLSVCVQRMLDYLKDKKDVGFFLSVQALMQTCRLFYLFDHHFSHFIVHIICDKCSSESFKPEQNERK